VERPDPRFAFRALATLLPPHALAQSWPVRRPPGFMAATARAKPSCMLLICSKLDGQDLRPEPWETRRAILMTMLRKCSHGIRFSEHIEGTDDTTIFGHACTMGLPTIGKAAQLGTSASTKDETSISATSCC
jgi:hypothetical protein